MGFFWAILMPILIVMAGIVVRYAYAIVAHAPLKTADIASVAMKAVPWAFIVSSIRFSCSSLTGNQDLVVKIYFPKEIFPMAAVLACLFDFFVAFAALVVFLILMRVGWSIYLLWVPLILATTVLHVRGYWNDRLRRQPVLPRCEYIVEVFLTFGIFFTPVFYDVRMFGQRGNWLLLNPVAPLLESLGRCIAHQEAPDFHWYLYSLTFSLVALLGGFILFKHLEPDFAESI